MPDPTPPSPFPLLAGAPLLDPAALTLTHNAFGKLCLTINGITHAGIRPIRALPLSNPHQWIFLLNAADKELGTLATTDGLAPDSRTELEAELDLAYFTTRITRIVNAQARHGVTTWELETERGCKTIHVKDRGDIRRLPGGHVQFADVYGMKYEIPRVDQLDARSRDFLETDS
jgi:hypothetical protein